MHEAPRCQHLKTDGIRCGSPALRGKPFCYNHGLIHDPRTPLGVPGYQLPPLECQADIQLAMRDAVQSYLDKRLTDIQARTVIYAISVVAPYACRPRNERPDRVSTEIPEAMLGTVPDTVMDAGRPRPAEFTSRRAVLRRRPAASFPQPPAPAHASVSDNRRG